jgi:hypothetical protein
MAKPRSKRKAPKATARARKPARKPAKKLAKKKVAVARKPRPPPARAAAAPVHKARGGPPLRKWFNKAVILDILGDAEAFVFDWEGLPPAKRQELVDHHLAAADDRLQAAGKGDWLQRLLPFALLGESLPRDVRGLFDLSAPHEGVLLWHVESGGILYCAHKDDPRLAIASHDLDSLNIRASFVDDTFDAARTTYAYAVDRSQSEEFTLGEIETRMEAAGTILRFV